MSLSGKDAMGSKRQIQLQGSSDNNTNKKTIKIQTCAETTGASRIIYPCGSFYVVSQRKGEEKDDLVVCMQRICKRTEEI